MSKRIYRWDTDGFFKDWDEVADDYQLKENETFVSPVDKNGFLNAASKWVNGTWAKPTSEDEAAYAAKLAKLYPNPTPSTPAGPSEQDKLNANTSVQLAHLVDKSKQQDQLNAQLTIDVATLKQALQKQDTKTTATTATTAQAKA